MLVKGILLRTGESASTEGDLKAFCTICPHEICDVEYVKDTRLIPVEANTVPEHPLLVCPCHFSVFDPVADGARVSGPATRGLYRFRFNVAGDTVRIDQIEKDVLTLLT